MASILDIVRSVFGVGRIPSLPPEEVRALSAPSSVALAPRAEEERSVRPVEIVPSSQVGRPARTGWSEATAIRDGLEDCSWVYVCLTLIARTASSVPWIVEQRRGQSWRRVEGHPLELLLAQPNEYWTAADLMEHLVLHLYLSGNGIISKVRDGAGAVGELWVLSSDAVQPILGDSFVKGYQVNKGGKKSELPAEDVIHGMFSNPGNPWWGLSPLKVAAEAAEGDVLASAWNLQMLKRSMSPSGILSFKTPLTPAQLENAQQKIGEKAGSSYAGDVLVLGSDAEFRPFDRSRKEMDWVDGRRLSREEIALVCGVPLPLISQDASTYNNLSLARRAFWRDTIGPLLSDVQGWLNLGLAPEFGDDLRVRPDLSEVDELSRFTPENIEAAQKLHGLGVPFNTIDRVLRLGVGPIPGGDVGYLPANLVPISSVGDDPNAG